MTSKDAQIAGLQWTIKRQTETIERLEKRIDELELELARAKKDSLASSDVRAHPATRNARC
jgi:hypothetical protein